MFSSIFLIYHVFRTIGRWVIGGLLYLVYPQKALEDMNMEAEHGQE